MNIFYEHIRLLQRMENLSQRNHSNSLKRQGDFFSLDTFKSFNNRHQSINMCSKYQIQHFSFKLA